MERPDGTLGQLAEGIVSCSANCPLRNEADGCYPKVFRGPLDAVGLPTNGSVRLVCLFMNPANPGSARVGAGRNPELDFSLGRVSWETSRELALKNWESWLFASSPDANGKISRELWSKFGLEPGRTVHITDVVKCPTAGRGNKAFRAASRICPDLWLKRELQLVSAPAILAFGREALWGLSRLGLPGFPLRFEAGVDLVQRFRQDPLMWDGPPKVFAAPHPAAMVRPRGNIFPQITRQDYERGLKQVFERLPPA